MITLVFHGGEEGNFFLCSDVFEPFAATTAWLKSDVVRRKEEDDFWVASEPGITRTDPSQCWSSKVLRFSAEAEKRAAVLLSQALLYLLLLHQPSEMWHDFALWEVERHLQGDQDGELE